MPHDEPGRPDPDALLKQVSAKRRATLRVFFGFAPGVGKTYRMLQVARELTSQGVSVLAGVVETHARYETHELLMGLDVLAPRKIEARGRVFEELDLDAALARKPQVLLLDELAHSNAPGARHQKRWQDALELLEAGIDVFTTLNVQHVESLNDVVAQITGVTVRETVPDSVLERAELELIDVGPEELRTRLQDGKVYLPDQAARALSGFFQQGNLLALRELALRRTAERVDVDVLAWREQHGVAKPWSTRERIVVCVGPAPASAKLIRAARRMAAGLRATWAAVWVEKLPSASLNEADQRRLEAHLKLAESLGGEVIRLTGPRVSDAVLEYARKTHVTRLILGKPTHPRVLDRLRGSLLDEVVRGSGEIEVHVISGDPERTDPGPAPAAIPTEKTSTRAWVMGVLLPLITTVVAVGIRALLPIPDLVMLYLLAVIGTAVGFGRGPAIVAAAISVAAYDFFFVPPFFTFQVADSRYVLTFVMMFGVAWIAGELTAQLKRQQRQAVQRETHTRSLYALSRELGALGTEAEVAQGAARLLATSLDVPALVLLTTATQSLTPRGAWPLDSGLEGTELSVAQWVLEHRRAAGRGTDTLPGVTSVGVPLLVGSLCVGVACVRLGPHRQLSRDERSLLDALGSQAASAIARLRITAEAEAAALAAKSEALRSSLLSSVSHDLRTPLASITGAATALRDTTAPLPEPQRTELIDSICEEAERLERLVGNLLEMTRLESGALRPKREWIPVDELISSALQRLESKLEGRDVRVTIDPHLPLLHVDPVLIEQVLLNLLDNAAKYTPSTAPLELRARLDGGVLVLEVADRGPGLAPEVKVFDKFVRGAHPGVGGAGLGLAIAKGMVDAHGGQIDASNRAGGGAVFTVRLPVPQEQPS